MEKNYIRKIISAVLCILIAVCVLSCNAKNPKDTVTGFFDALNQLDFETAGEFLGDPSYYETLIQETDGAVKGSKYDNLQSLYFIEFIYANIEYEITDDSYNGGTYSCTCKITAYNAEEVLKKVYDDSAETMNTSAYSDATDPEKYAMLCNRLKQSYEEMSDELVKNDAEIEIKVTKQNKKYCIMPDETLFKALGGDIKQ